MIERDSALLLARKVHRDALEYLAMFKVWYEKAQH
jgi:hypothetical protein